MDRRCERVTPNSLKEETCSILIIGGGRSTVDMRGLQKISSLVLSMLTLIQFSEPSRGDVGIRQIMVCMLTVEFR